MVSKQHSSFGAFRGPFSDLIRLTEDNNHKELKKYITPARISANDINRKVDSLTKEIINPLFIEKLGNVKKEKYNNNLFYCFNDFYSDLKVVDDNNLGSESEKYRKAVRKFINGIKEIYPWKLRLKFNNLDELIKFVNAHRKRFKKVRKEGRPASSFNILIYYLVNKFTFYKYDNNQKLIYCKNGLIRMTRDWNLICYVLLWIHFYIFPFKEIEQFIKEHKNDDAKPMLDFLKKKLQRKYSHFKSKNGEWKIYQADLKKIILTDNGYKVIYR